VGWLQGCHKLDCGSGSGSLDSRVDKAGREASSPQSLLGLVKPALRVCRRWCVQLKNTLRYYKITTYQGGGIGGSVRRRSGRMCGCKGMGACLLGKGSSPGRGSGPVSRATSSEGTHAHNSNGIKYAT